MSFQEVAWLAKDAAFGDRLSAALTTESMPKPDDPLADEILKEPYLGTKMFMPLVSSAPGFGDKYAAGGHIAITDADILAAVQGSWQRVTDLYDLGATA